MKSLATIIFIAMAILPVRLFAQIHIEQATVFSAKAGEQTAIFMNIYNTGENTVTLKAVQSPMQSNIALRGLENGKMHNIAVIDVPPKEMTPLKRGGFHIMVFNVEQDLVVGKTFPLHLLFDNGQTIDIEAKIITN
ncbi:copper chaperone PCu(A)C [Pasteurella sp. PK-2025]|uniref:copper chaperone PCu(A)C n=1 Tax=unclassified Pasteurella TaxID=2621516 RepID=UPI003C72D7A6